MENDNFNGKIYFENYFDSIKCVMREEMFQIHRDSVKYINDREKCSYFYNINKRGDSIGWTGWS